jgi:hypothetical protein
MQAVGILECLVDQATFGNWHILCVQMNYALISRSIIVYCGLQKKKSCIFIGRQTRNNNWSRRYISRG